MKVFLDTNVLVDFIEEREGAKDASDILQLGKTGGGSVELCASVLTMANAAYIARKGRTKENLYAALSLLSGLIDVLPMDGEQWLAALHENAKDLEDALQYECAKAAGCTCIVTRNTRDFGFSHLPVYTPAEFLNSDDWHF